MRVLAGALLSILLGWLLTSTLGALGANPGLVTRITNKGLEYAARKGLLALEQELHGTTLPDFSGDFKIHGVGKGKYSFYSLEVHSCDLRGSTLRPLPGHGLSLSVSDSSIRLRGRWKVHKAFLKLQESFDLSVKGITISVDLQLGSEPSGRPTVTTSKCSGRIREVDVDISGGLRWMLNLFHNQIESKFRSMLESKICELIQKSVTSDLQPYLQTLPVTADINDFLSIDYSLVEAPRATAQMLDVLFKGEIFQSNHHSSVSLLAPVMHLPGEHNKMVYFAISDYVFNTASLVYHEAGYLSFSITNDMILPDSVFKLTTKSFRAFAPKKSTILSQRSESPRMQPRQAVAFNVPCRRLARLYPNMNLELQGAVASAPLLNFSSGNLSLAPLMEIEGFVLLPDSEREPVFRLSVATNVSITLNFNTTKISGSMKPEKVQVELKESKVGQFNMELLEAFVNYYLVNVLYPEINDKLAIGLPLPLLKRVQLYDLVVQIHKNFLFLGANVQYVRA
ncbi:lipopolysaccharide-binding protein isoform X1 [Lemur catta]|uniref:lipopolysaccharide-binding protein isoform X1 n=1 Tax=Lemur catta TaxID=9447 RepID=UPI001E266966|nr:lipopolysaccharide-binding protein isoform X1 [Lemur catta]